MAMSACGSGGSSGPAAPSPLTLTGTVRLTSGDGIARPPGTGECFGMNGYEDLAPGADVTVTDASSKVVGVGTLGTGTSKGQFSCMFPVTVTDLPRSNFYGVEVAHRGVVHFSLAQVTAGDVHLTIGN